MVPQISTKCCMYFHSTHLIYINLIVVVVGWKSWSTAMTCMQIWHIFLHLELWFNTYSGSLKITTFPVIYTQNIFIFLPRKSVKAGNAIKPKIVEVLYFELVGLKHYAFDTEKPFSIWLHWVGRQTRKRSSLNCFEKHHWIFALITRKWELYRLLQSLRHVVKIRLGPLFHEDFQMGLLEVLQKSLLF